jgi:glycosyltransferase involved in cell wall biosynthesis
MELPWSVTVIRKAAVFMATYNKNKCLPNTLHSLSVQKTRYPLEVCIIDDCSDEDPLPIIKEHLTLPYKYHRLDKHVGFKKSQNLCLRIASSDVDAVIMQSCDVISASPNVIDLILDNLAPTVATMPEVVNAYVPPSLYTNFEEGIQHYLTTDFTGTSEHVYYAGPRQPAPDRRWYFFHGAMLLDDLLRTCYLDNCFDVALSNSMHELGYRVKYVDALAVHQRHT